MTLDTSLGQKKGGEDQRAFQLDPCVTVVELNAMCLMGSIDSEWSIFDFIRQAPLMQVLPRPLKSKGSSVMSRRKLEAADVFRFLPLEHMRVITYCMWIEKYSIYD